MNLSFSKHWPNNMGDMADKPTKFIESILASLPAKDVLLFYLKEYGLHLMDKKKVVQFFLKKGYEFDHAWYILASKKNENFTPQPKIQTIRRDSRNRWKAGNNIDFIINPTSITCQFAPVIEVKSVQRFEVVCEDGVQLVFIDDELFFSGRDYTEEKIASLAKNDGFNSVEHFFRWFSEPGTGKIIHWTDLKY